MPVWGPTKAQQIQLYAHLKTRVRKAENKLRIIVDEWCNTLEDIREFADAGAGDLVQVKTPDLGGIQNSVEAVLYCRSRGMGTSLGGTANEIEHSAQITAHVGLSCARHPRRRARANRRGYRRADGDSSSPLQRRPRHYPSRRWLHTGDGSELSAKHMFALCERSRPRAAVPLIDKYHVRKVGDLLHAEREDHAVLQAMKNALGSFNFAAQYQQTPISEDGELFKLKWFRTYVSEPARTGNDSVVQSWDTAHKAGQLNNYSVCTTWLVKVYFLLDVFRQKLGFPDLIRAIQSQADRFRPNSILIEDKASGTALIRELDKTRLPRVPYPIPIEPEAAKITRAAHQSAAIEAGHVYLPQKADWLMKLRNELVQFPYGRYDDEVDSITQFLKWVRTHQIWASHIEVIWPT